MIFHTYLKRILFLILFIGSLAASHAQGLVLEDGYGTKDFQGQDPTYRITVEVEMNSEYSFRIFDSSTGSYIFNGFSFVPSENSGINERNLHMYRGEYSFYNYEYGATKYCMNASWPIEVILAGRFILVNLLHP